MRRSQRMRSMLVLSAAVFALAGAGASAAHPLSSTTTTVDVTAKDFSFALSTKSVKPGHVTFVIHNSSPVAHDFAIAGETSKTIGPAKTTRLSVTLRPGSYPYKCTVDSHAELGMKGVLTVKR
jgi:plastocyanin